jgi:hypothetical protein
MQNSECIMNIHDGPYIYQKSKKNKKKEQHEQQNNNTRDEKNKRLMCNNMLKNGNCGYGNKCVFSHSLKEQRKDPVRKIVYDYINKKDAVYDNLEIIHDKNIIKTLYLFTKKCSSCEHGKCPGGYNCNTGVISSQYILCANDLSYGCCMDNNCNKIHLSKKGYCVNKNHKLNENIGVTLDDLFFYEINCIDQLNVNHNDSDVDSCESDESYERIKEYLNSTDNETYDESIFILNNIKQQQ